MAPATKKPAFQAEVVLLPSLKSCLVNLPASLVAHLTNANTVRPGLPLELLCILTFSEVRAKRRR
jgi:peroxin-1